MKLIRLSDGQYPCTINDVGQDYPNRYIPHALPDNDFRSMGYALVTPQTAPIIDPDTQTVTEGTPAETEGIYRQTWVVTSLPEDEQAAIAAAKGKQTIILATNAAQTHIDSVAQARGYDSGLSCISYAGGSHPVYSVEGAAFRDWRDAVWDYCNALAAAVQTGTAPMPTIENYLAGIPVMVWPG